MKHIRLITLVCIFSLSQWARANACNTNSDCPMPEVCWSNQCQNPHQPGPNPPYTPGPSPGQCSSSGQCGSGYSCISGRCTWVGGGSGNPCNWDSECGVGSFCIAHRCSVPNSGPISAPRPATQVLRCQSVGVDFTRCAATDVVISVLVLNQISREPCIYGQTYGDLLRGVWTSQGCAADFLVRYHW